MECYGGAGFGLSCGGAWGRRGEDGRGEGEIRTIGAARQLVRSSEASCIISKGKRASYVRIYHARPSDLSVSYSDVEFEFRFQIRSLPMRDEIKASPAGYNRLHSQISVLQYEVSGRDA